MGQVSGQDTFWMSSWGGQAHPIEKVWIRPWMCRRNYVSHLVCEHLAIPPHPSKKLEEITGDAVWNWDPCEPNCGCGTAGNIMIAREIYTCSTTRKQTNAVYVIEFRLSPDFAANPYTFALKKLEVIYVYLHFSQQPCVIFPLFTFAALLQS